MELTDEHIQMLRQAAEDPEGRGWVMLQLEVLLALCDRTTRGLEALDAGDYVTLEALKAMVAEQAEDEGLWFDAQYVTEAYLQQELRRLHEAIEGSLGHSRHWSHAELGEVGHIGCNAPRGAWHGKVDELDGGLEDHCWSQRKRHTDGGHE